MKKAWEYEAENRNAAVPKPYGESPPDWSGPEKIMLARKSLLSMLWESEVPESRAPERMFLEMVQAWGNRGYDVSAAEALLPEALKIVESKNWGSMERITGRIRKALREAAKIAHPAWGYDRPENWDAVRSAIPGFAKQPPQELDLKHPDILDRITRAWIGQIAGGAYGTAIEGYRGKVLKEVFGDKLASYIHPVNTLNDDITYEIAFLRALESSAENISSNDIADQWLELIPFGWSAEYIALENLRQGIYPPESGSFNNYFSEWIGAQMRTMVCGLVAPGRPDKAVKLAYIDGRVSHEVNGIFGGLHSAALTALSFCEDDPQKLVEQSIEWLPRNSEFSSLLIRAVERAAAGTDPGMVWESWEEEMKTYNWIHTYPNMIANVIALWYSDGDMTRAFRILGECGMDVDCNAGMVGTVLGIQRAIPEPWSSPLGNELRTYLPKYEKMKITDLSKWTHTLALSLKNFQA